MKLIHQKHDSHVSVSKLKLEMSCMRKYWFKYYKHLVEEDRYWFTRGLVFHETIEEYLKDTKRSKKYLHDFAELKFKEFKKEGKVVSDFRTTEDTVLKTIMLAIDAYTAKIKKLKKFRVINYNDGVNIEQKCLELEFRIPFVDLDTMKPFNDIDKDLYGFIDAITYDETNGLSVRDHKLVSTKYSDFAVKTDIQLGLYAYVFIYLLRMGCFKELKADNIKDINVGFNCNLINKQNGLKVTSSFVNNTLNLEQIKAHVKLATDLIRNEKTSLFTPSFSNDNCYFCDFKEPCLAMINGQNLDDFLKKNPKFVGTDKRKEKLKDKVIADLLFDLESGDLF